MDVAIRPWREDDAPALSAAVTSSLPELLPWMPWARAEPLSDAARRAYIREANEEEARGGDRVRAITADGEIAGACGLHRRIGPNAFELGYWLASGYTGRGIATTAVSLLAAAAFSDPGVTHIEIHHDPANTRSAAVARRSGFTPMTDRHRESLDTETIWRLTRTEWEARA